MNLQKALESAREEITKKYGDSLITTVTADEIINNILNNEKVTKRINKIKSGERDMGEYFNTTVSIASKCLSDLSESEYSYIDLEQLLVDIFKLTK